MRLINYILIFNFLSKLILIMLSSVNLNYDTTKNKLFFMNNNEKVHVYLRQSGGRNYIVPINKKYRRVHVSGLPKKLLINKDAYSNILDQVKNYPVIHKKDGLYYLNNKVQSSLKKAMKKLRRYQTGGANTNIESETDTRDFQQDEYHTHSTVVYNIYCNDISDESEEYVTLNQTTIKSLVERRAREIFKNMNESKNNLEKLDDYIETIEVTVNEGFIQNENLDGSEDDKLSHFKFKNEDGNEDKDKKLNNLVEKRVTPPSEDGNKLDNYEKNNTVRGPRRDSHKFHIIIKGDSSVVNENIFKEKSKITIGNKDWYVLYVRDKSRLQGLLTNWDDDGTKQGQIVSSYIGDDKDPERKNRFGRSVGYLKNITERLRDCTDISVAYKEKHKEVEQMIITIRKLYSLIIFLRDQISKNQENYETLEKLILEIMIAMKSDVHISEGELTRLKMIQKKIQDDGVELEKKFRIVSNQILDRLQKADALKEESPVHIGPDFPTVPDVKYDITNEKYMGADGKPDSAKLQSHIAAVNPGSYTLKPKKYDPLDEHESTRYFQTKTIKDPLTNEDKNISTGEPRVPDPDPFFITNPKKDKEFKLDGSDANVSPNQYGKFTRGLDYQNNSGDEQWVGYDTKSDKIHPDMKNSPDVPSIVYNQMLDAPHEDWRKKRLKDLKRTKEKLTRDLHETARKQFEETTKKLEGSEDTSIRSVAYDESKNELKKGKQPNRDEEPGDKKDAKTLTEHIKVNPEEIIANQLQSQEGGSRNRRSKLQKLKLKKSKYRKIRKSLKNKLKKSKILLKKYKNLSRMYRHSAKKQKKYN